MTDFLDEKRREITDRLKELKPLVDEFNRLEAAASALAGAVGSVASEATSAVAATVTHRRGRGRPRGSVNRASNATPAAASPATPVATPVKATRKKRGRPPGRSVGRVGRRKGSGRRAAQALALVQGQPGITIPELAAKMGIKQNYLYRVLPGLEQDGKVEKKDRGWYPKKA
ncbi:MAG: hypothetical protein ACHQC8_01875 [Solirubrobacterales bacterium]